MSLSTDLIDQFVAVTNDEKKEPKEATVYGTVVKVGESLHVQLDGSTEITPAITTTHVEDGQRVSVLIKNHTATITGNLTDPSVGSSRVEKAEGKILEFDTAIGKKLSVDELTAKTAFIDKLISNDITTEHISAVKADIEELVAGTITADELEAKYAHIQGLDAGWANLITANIATAMIDDLTVSYAYARNLDANFGSFKQLYADEFAARDAVIKNLQVEKLDANAADMKYANIDFANIGDAAIRQMFANTGLIDNLVVGDGVVVSGDLTVVTLNASNIKSGTMTADRLLLKGADDGLYYQLNLNALGEAYVTDLTEEEQRELQNGIHGENIIANSITAKHIVADDLTAFGATIADFRLVPANPKNLLTDESADAEVFNDLRVHRTLQLINPFAHQGNTSYTISFIGTLPKECETWYVDIERYNKYGELIDIPPFITTFKEINGRWVGTGTMPEIADGSIGKLNLYAAPIIASNTTHNSNATTSKIKLELGTKATDYTPSPGKLYSFPKSGPRNSNRGVYMDTDGQFAIGDGNNYIKFYNDNGTYKLDLKTSEIRLNSGKTVEQTVDNISLGARNLITAASGKNIVSNNYYSCRCLEFHESVILIPGAEYTLSFIGELPSDATSWTLYVSIRDVNGNNVENPIFIDPANFKRVNGRWVGTGVCPECADELVYGALYLYPYPYVGEYRNSNATTSYFKFEIGNKATDWSPAPEDFDASISASEEAIYKTIRTNAGTIETIQSLLKGETPADAAYIDMGNIREFINEMQGKLSSLYISDGEKEANCMLLEKDGTGVTLDFATAITDILTGLRSDMNLSGRIKLTYDEFGDAYISIEPSDEGCKLKLTAEDIEFIGRDDRIAAIITSDENDSMTTENITVKNELRQSNPIFSTRNLLTAASSEATETNNKYSHRCLDLHDINTLEPDEMYTLSFDGNLPSGATSWTLFISIRDVNGNNISNPEFIKPDNFKRVNGRWVGTGVCPTLPDGASYGAAYLYPYPYKDPHPSNATTKELKLELGKKATEYTLAPEDVAANNSNITNGYYVWEVRTNGNYGLSWKGD